MNEQVMQELLYQALETEQGGVRVYETAVRCAVNDDLKKEWTEYLEQTARHVEIVTDAFAQLGLDSGTETPGRQIMRMKADTLVRAMETALGAGKPDQAQIVAAECVVEAETKDHQNWELIGMLVEKATGDTKKVLKEAHEQVEEEEDEHLYHTMGWARELWVEALGMPAVLPPPEEKKDVKTMIGASRAKQARGDMT